VLKRNGKKLKQMSKEKDAAWREMMKRADESRDNTFDSWIVDSTDLDPKDECCEEQEDCENCES
jgi:hypothetical protein